MTCVGPNEGKEQTFVLLDEWAPEQRALEGEEALAELALRYFRSHGPTTRQDFAGWAGITAAEAKAGIAGAGEALAEAAYDGSSVWMAADLPDRAADVVAGGDAQRVRLLPGFDEFLLGYKDRSIPVPRDQCAPDHPGQQRDLPADRRARRAGDRRVEARGQAHGQDAPGSRCAPSPSRRSRREGPRRSRPPPRSTRALPASSSPSGGRRGDRGQAVMLAPNITKAPVGSVMPANRIGPMSMAGNETVAPSSVARARVASQSATAK